MSHSDSIILLNHSDINIATSIHTLFQASYLLEAKLIGLDSFPPLERTIDNIQNSKTKFWGYYKNDNLAALAEIELNNRLLDIQSFVVSPTYFRKGIGSKLLHYLLTSLEFDSAVVETASANTPAIDLYKKFGFVQIRKWLAEIGIEKVRLKI